MYLPVLPRKAKVWYVFAMTTTDDRAHITRESMDGIEVPKTPMDLGFPIYVKLEDIKFMQQYFTNVVPTSTLPKIKEVFWSDNRKARRQEKRGKK